ncbi:zinc-ribbon domain-containing protein [Butyrivibrio proteoclasticus]|uniref:zinc-ribbon domain-containing protein n=1 Tax=Butyrivibrio proteoclasticus TaxID=43305 RepID=UPI00047E2BE7|nr:zinc-ribbon domain-containing protein [Butyrivibrio proteoclasticus]
MICPNCGSVIDDNSMNCPYCGAYVAGATNNMNNGQYGYDQYSNQNGYNQQYDQYGNQNGYDQYGYQDSYNQQYDQYGYQDPYYGNTQVQPKKKHTVLKTILILILVAAVGFGGFKGWGFLSKRMNAEPTGSDVATLDSSAVTESVASLKELMKDTVAFVNENAINGKKTDREEALESMEGYLEDFNEIEGLPENVQLAADEFFVTLYNAYKNSRDNYVYKATFKEFADDFSSVASMEVGNDFNSFIDDSNDIISDIQETYDEIEDVPPLFASEHEHFGQNIALFEDCLTRLQDGNNNNDFVSFMAALTYFRHICSEFTTDIDQMDSVADSATSFNAAQRDLALSIYNEFKEVFKLTEAEDIAAYEFKTTNSNTLSYDYDAISQICPSLYNCYRQFLRLELGCVSGEKDVVVECQISGLTEKYEETIHVTNSMSLYAIKPPADVDSATLTSARDAQMNVTISETDGTIIDTQTFLVHITSQNDFNWNSDEFGYINQDNILCYLTPDSDLIVDFRDKAQQALSELTNGAMTDISADHAKVYNDYTDTYLVASAAMIALSDYGVRYNNDGFSLESQSQHILLPDEVLTNKTGLCIETTLVIASMLKGAGYNTFILLPTGHAQVAVETYYGSGQYILIETTYLPNDPDVYVYYANALLEGQLPEQNYNFPNALYTTEEWYQYILDGQPTIISCDDAESLGLTPFDY